MGLDWLIESMYELKLVRDLKFYSFTLTCNSMSAYWGLAELIGMDMLKELAEPCSYLKRGSVIFISAEVEGSEFF